MSPGRSEDSPTWVLDASALLALLQGEPGSEIVERHLADSAMSTVNWAEVIQKLIERELPTGGIRQEVEHLGVRFVPLSSSQAERTGALRKSTRTFGLSLGDRACLALAQELGSPVVTTDREWANLNLGIEVIVARP